MALVVRTLPYVCKSGVHVPDTRYMLYVGNVRTNPRWVLLLPPGGKYHDMIATAAFTFVLMWRANAESENAFGIFLKPIRIDTPNERRKRIGKYRRARGIVQRGREHEMRSMVMGDLELYSTALACCLPGTYVHVFIGRENRARTRRARTHSTTHIGIHPPVLRCQA